MYWFSLIVFCFAFKKLIVMFPLNSFLSFFPFERRILLWLNQKFYTKDTVTALLSVILCGMVKFSSVISKTHTVSCYSI